MKNLSHTRERSPLGRLYKFLNVAARSWQFGLLLMAIAAVVVVNRWDLPEMRSLGELPFGSLVLAGLAYASGLVVLTYVSVLDVENRLQSVGRALRAQVLKYIPGSVWQVQALLAEGGRRSVAIYGASGILAAGQGLLFSPYALVAVCGLVIVAGTVLVAAKTLGPRSTLICLFAASVLVGTIWVSGGLVGAGLGLGFLESARQIASAWAVGVVAIPVPAGLGIREMYLAIGSPSLVELGIAHRLVTFLVDLVVPIAGLVVSTAQLVRPTESR